MNFVNVIFLGCVILVLTACSDNMSVETYISDAEKLITEEQNNAAIIALKNAVSVDAKNAQARFLLGRLYVNIGDAENAVKELERANKLGYDTNKVLPLLARAYLLTEADDDILALATQERLLTTGMSQYLAYKSMAFLRTGQEALAEKTVDAALSISETDSYSLLANAYLAFAQQNTARASMLAARILTATPDNADALMLQGQVATVEKNYPLAVDSFKAYLALQPRSGKVQLFIADALTKNGQYKEAEAIADTILANVPNQPFLQYIKAMARFEEKDYQTASSYANQSLNSGFNAFSLKLVAGASAFYLQNYEQSHLHLQDILPYLTLEHPARRMLAISQLQLGLIDDISETLIDYDTSNKANADFLATLSYGLLEAGAYEKAQEMANHASFNSQAMSAEQTARAGVLKLMMNDPSGIDNLELALQQNPELVSAELALAFALINSGDLPRATKIADKWLDKYPNKAGGHNLKATIFFKNNQLKQGQSSLEKSLQLEPNNVYALTEMVKLAHYQNQPEKAELLTEQALQAHPNNIKVLTQYFSLHADEQGLQVITKAQQNNAGDINYGVLLAEALIHLQQFKQASAVLNDYQVSVKTPKRYWQLVLAANAKQPDGKELLLILEQWHKTNPYHLEPVLLLANYWSSKKSPDKALSVLTSASSKHPNNPVTYLVKIQILLNNNRPTDAKFLLKALDRFDLNKDLQAGIEGRILLLERNFSAAVPKLKQQYQAKPNSRNAVYFAAALEGNKQMAEAITLLEPFSDQYGEAHNVDPRVRLSLANLYLAEHQGKAIVEYERLIIATPDNVIVLNNLAWLYMEQEQFTQALVHAQKAYKLAATIPNVVDTYAQVLLKLKKKVEALAKAKEAYELVQGKDVDIALNYVEALLANNKHVVAKQTLGNIMPVTALQKEKKQLLSK